MRDLDWSCRQNRTPTCPLCNRNIEMKVQYRLPHVVRRLRAWLTLPQQADDAAQDFLVRYTLGPGSACLYSMLAVERS